MISWIVLQWLLSSAIYSRSLRRTFLALAEGHTLERDLPRRTVQPRWIHLT